MFGRSPCGQRNAQCFSPSGQTLVAAEAVLFSSETALIAVCQKDHHTLSQLVPVPCVTYQCTRYCCERTSCPLKLSFARTIDTFQGQTAGPTEPGKPPHDVERVILDPGSRAFEARGKTGLSYTMISRGTTLGHLDDNGKRMDSAIYFYDFGLGVADLPLSATRLAELRGPVGHPNKPYNAVVRRDNWVDISSHIRIPAAG